MTTLHQRNGQPYTGPHATDSKGPFFTRLRRCSRCGGAGGSDKWAHTGYTCYDCGGRCYTGTETVRLYTAEQVAKLDAAAAKRRATAQRKADAKAAAAAAEAAARADAFNAEHGALLARADAFIERSPFIKDVVRKARERCLMTPAQAEAVAAAVAKIEAADAVRAASGHVGRIGERITLTVTAERMVSTETQFGTLHIATMRDTSGNAIIAKGRFVPPTATWDRDAERWRVTAEPFTIKATVKEHGCWRDEQQTTVQRVSVVGAATTEAA